jgi:hypothetical protein
MITRTYPNRPPRLGRRSPQQNRWAILKGIFDKFIPAATLIIAVIALMSSVNISGFESLLKKYDTLIDKTQTVVSEEGGQSQSLIRLIEKNNEIDSLLQLQISDLIENRRLERRANYNKLNMALADLTFNSSKIDDVLRRKEPIGNAIPFIGNINRVFANQVDNPFLLANDSAIVRWKFRHGQTSIIFDMLQSERAGESVVVGPHNRPDYSAEANNQANLKIVDMFTTQTMELYFWFKKNILPPK